MLCTGFAYFLFFRLIQRVSATRAATCNYLIPVFGVIWGWWLLGETPTPTMLVSGALILGSVIFSQRELARPARVVPIPIANRPALADNRQGDTGRGDIQ